MMKRFLIALLMVCASLLSYSQDSSVQQIARDYMRVGDWDNAILVLNRGVLAEPKNLDLQKDLALSYYYKKDYTRAREGVEAMLDRDDADVVVYQIAGNVYKALEEVKEADKMYKKAIKKFPDNGALYSEYGELLWAKKDMSAIKLWEQGIQAAPNFAGNYYNAALYYYYTKDKVWTLIYGEIFVNMEYLTPRATEMKKLILSAYKEKLFNNLGSEDNAAEGSFAKAVLKTYYRQANLVNKGMNFETLNRLRTRFIIDWYPNYGKKFSYKLFDWHEQLIRDGLFEAYNQWLFGPAENLSAFDQWAKTNADTYARFTKLQQSRVFKMPKEQFYGEKD